MRRLAAAALLAMACASKSPPERGADRPRVVVETASGARHVVSGEQVVALPLNMLSFRQPKDMTRRLRGMIKQLYGEGVMARAADLWRKLT